ncbi:alpha/beta fold hydrolase [Amycolatopsis alkalitolerans]|uniref:alpha/beta fold hydrolase n=1 Tax=Amycolatopsis alkalitolerans TaxID=2547244 RepID=UPI00190FBD6A|nr:alpha/beta fold hydrolase [Amycolatopsis alkalitolerans]
MFRVTAGPLSDVLAIRPGGGLTVGVTSGSEEWAVEIGSFGYKSRRGRPEVAHLRFSAAAETWAGYFRPVPQRGYGTIAGLHRLGVMTVEGDLVVFFRDQLLIEYAFTALRQPCSVESPSPDHDGVVFEPVHGRYIRMSIAGRRHRLYVEEAGTGIPLLCLHTAGSDSRQYRALLNDAEITDRFRVVAFDLPWHGKSSPPAGYQDEAYSLTVDQYGAVIIAVCDALRLD